MQFLLQFFLSATAIIVIILVMLQRGKGGGLAGALGGAGGQSAFGTKAGDLFTKITVGVAAVWILISIFAAIYAPYLSGGAQYSATQNVQQNPAPSSETPGAGKPADNVPGKADKSGKSAEKLPEKPTAPSATPPGAAPPTAPTAVPPAAPPAKASATPSPTAPAK